MFLRLTLFFVVNSFWANFYVGKSRLFLSNPIIFSFSFCIIGTMDIQLGDSNLYDIEERQDYDRIFALLMTCGVLGIPIVGTMMDGLGFPVTSLTLITFGCLWSLCLFSQIKSLLILSFILYALFRTFLFTFLFAYAADTLGFKYFGILVGIMFVAGGVVSLLQYPLTQWATGTCHNISNLQFSCLPGRWIYIHLLMIITMFLSYSFTYYDWIRRKSISSLKKVNSIINDKSFEEYSSTQSYQHQRKSKTPLNRVGEDEHY